MDRITGSLLKTFCAEQGLQALAQDKQFENFTAHIILSRHLSETFNVADIITGGGSDLGLDAIAIIVNGALVTDLDEFIEFADSAPYLDVVFVFVQAERTSGFDAAKIGNIAYGVQEYFSENQTMPQNAAVTNSVAIMREIYDRSVKLTRGNPSCRIYYATTGEWVGDANLESRRKTAISDISSYGTFGLVDFECIGKSQIQKLYQQSKNTIARTFNFTNKVVVPDIPGVKESHLGFIPFTEFRGIISNDTGDEIISSLFYDNVRDWLGAENEVNGEIKETLASDKKPLFVLMNNGITIIAREMRSTGQKFHISDFQIVNGCQTSHSLFEERATLDQNVLVPLRLISTEDEGVIESIIKATNRQTELKPEQFFALTEFAKLLEKFFQSFPADHKLYYERRLRQYDRLPIVTTRSITPKNMIRAYAAAFLAEPHVATRRYTTLRARVGADIFKEGQRLEPYYVAAYIHYKLEFLFRAVKIDPQYKVARFHIHLAVRLLANGDPLPPWNSKKMEAYCEPIWKILWDADKADKLFVKAIAIIDAAADGKYDRDSIRSEAFTKAVIDAC